MEKRKYEAPAVSPPIEPERYCGECSAPVLVVNGDELETHEATCSKQMRHSAAPSLTVSR